MKICRYLSVGLRWWKVASSCNEQKALKSTWGRCFGSLRQIILAGLLIVIAFNSLYSQTTGSLPTKTVSFPDTGLEAAVREALSMPSGDITTSDMLGLTNLYAGWRGIQDTTGLETAANLSVLNFDGNNPTNFSGLVGLTNLTSLSLSACPIGDISFMPSLTNLTFLVLAFDSFSDIAPLSQLTRLNYLELGGNAITDWSPLSGLTNVTSLQLYWNPAPDITPLASLTQVTDLNLDGDGVTDITPLIGLTNVTTLHLAGDAVTNIDVLTNLTLLQWFQANNAGLRDASYLTALTNLQTLMLNGNQLTSLPLLGSLRGLTTIQLDGNPLSDLNFLADVSILNVLSINGASSLTNFSALSQTSKLTWLSAQNAGLSNLASLPVLTNLIYLDLALNNIIEAQPLAAFTSLQILNLDDNFLTSIEALKNLPLIELHVLRNQLNLTAGTEAANDVHSLLNRGVWVDYDPQYPLAPVVFTQPANRTVTAGSTASFAVVISGAQPLVYQWQFDGTNINNSTNATLTLTNVQLSDAGNYSVAVTNDYGFVMSSNAFLTVDLQSPCTPAPSGLIAWWRAEGDPFDALGTNNGTITNITFADGRVGQAFSFDGGNGCVSIPDSPLLDSLGSNITIEAWIKVNVFSQGWQAIVTKGDNSWRLQRNGWNSTIAFDTDDLSNFSLPSSKTLDDGQWHHVAAVYDGAFKYLYIDGALDASAPATGSIHQNSYPICIGENAEMTGRNFNGLIDEVSIYNRGLSAVEIAAIYNAGSSGKCANSLQPVLLITSQPVGQVVNLGEPVSFSITVDGTAPLSYFWYKDGSPLNINESSIRISSAASSDAGTYWVVVTNSAGTLESEHVTLAVLMPQPPAAATLTLSLTSPLTAGTPASVTLIARDTNGNVAASYRGTVNFTSSDPQAVLPENYSFVLEDYGSHTFTNAVVMKTAGTQSFTAEDTTNQLLTITQGGILVLPGPASSLSVSGIPTSIAAGTPANLAINIRDAYGNLAADYTGTVHFSSSDPLAVLPSDYTFTPDDGGTHIFDNLLTLNSGGTQSVTVTDTLISSISGTQEGIMVLTLPSVGLQQQWKYPDEFCTFHASVTGTGPFAYQWYFNDTPISGATAETYGPFAATYASAGTYSLVVSNVVGLSTNSAKLVVAPVFYEIHDIGTLWSNNSVCIAHGLNNWGEVVGSCISNGVAPCHAWVWSHGVLTDLGDGLGGDDARAYSINDQGDIVGTARVPGTTNYDAVRWRKVGTSYVLDDLGRNGWPFAFAQCINNAGDIAFAADDGGFNGGGNRRSWLLRNGSLLPLGNLTPAWTNDDVGDACGWAMTSLGQIAGSSWNFPTNSHRSRHSWFYNGGYRMNLDATYSLTNIPGIESPLDGSAAFLINDFGDIAGSYDIFFAEAAYYMPYGVYIASGTNKINASHTAENPEGLNNHGDLIIGNNLAGYGIKLFCTTNTTAPARLSDGRPDYSDHALFAIADLLPGGFGPFEHGEFISLEAEDYQTFPHLNDARAIVGQEATDDGVHAFIISPLPRPGNHSPIAVNDAITNRSSTVVIPIGALLANDADPDGDPLALLTFHTPSTDGATIRRSANSLIYTATNTAPGLDSFTYVVMDFHGGTSTGAVQVVTQPTGPLPMENLMALVPTAGSTPVIRFHAVPGQTCRVLVSDGVDGKPWTTLATAIAGPDGLIDVTDVLGTNQPQRFYRAVSP